jgi:hypothetical protein
VFCAQQSALLEGWKITIGGDQPISIRISKSVRGAFSLLNQAPRGHLARGLCFHAVTGVRLRHSPIVAMVMCNMGQIIEQGRGRDPAPRIRSDIRSPAQRQSPRPTSCKVGQASGPVRAHPRAATVTSAHFVQRVRLYGITTNGSGYRRNQFRRASPHFGWVVQRSSSARVI